MAFEPCSSCGKLTEYRCVDCAIDKREYIPVCENPECRDKHEEKFCSRLTGKQYPNFERIKPIRA